MNNSLYVGVEGERGERGEAGVLSVGQIKSQSRLRVQRERKALAGLRVSEIKTDNSTKFLYFNEPF